MAEKMTDGIIVAGLVLFSLAYCISCTRWAEDHRAAEGVGPYGEEAGDV